VGESEWVAGGEVGLWCECGYDWRWEWSVVPYSYTLGMGSPGSGVPQSSGQRNGSL